MYTCKMHISLLMQMQESKSNTMKLSHTINWN